MQCGLQCVGRQPHNGCWWWRPADNVEGFGTVWWEWCHEGERVSDGLPAEKLLPACKGTSSGGSPEARPLNRDGLHWFAPCGVVCSNDRFELGRVGGVATIAKFLNINPLPRCLLLTCTHVGACPLKSAPTKCQHVAKPHPSATGWPESNHKEINTFY